MRHEVPSTVKSEETLPGYGERPATPETNELILPVAERMSEIVDTVKNNRISILVAETGAGKTTLVPPGLEKAGFKVSVTQPRRMAARMIAARIDEELATELGDDNHGLVGFHTAASNTVTSSTRIEILTDGLRLAQELHTDQTWTDEEEVLVIDEVHERNANLDILSAWACSVIKERPNLRILFMSATINSEALVDHIAESTGLRPPVMEVEGRTFGVERREEPNSTALLEAIKVIEANQTLITVLPGVREINDLKDAIETHFANAGRSDITVLPLHSKLSEDQQNATTRIYAGPKSILGTNMIQTSMTFADADVVIDCGLSRRVEIDEEGVESLRLYNVPQADCNQRAGRVGRTHPGMYILTRLNEDTEFVPFNERDEYPMPEILRSNIDRHVLQLACAGKTLADLKLQDAVKPEVAERARHNLHLLGAMDEQGNITPRGRHMNKFPVHPTSARMLVEAESYSDEIQSYVAAIAAAMEVGKLPSYLYTANKNWQELIDDKMSDHLAQLDLFIAIQDIASRRELAELGLDIHNVERARELHDKIIRRAGTRPQQLQPPTSAQREEILECVTAGLVDFVYQKSDRGAYSRVKGATVERSISNRSIIRGGEPKLVVGVPYNYEHHVKGEMHVIDSVSPTTAATLGKVASWLCTWEQTGVKWRGGQPVHEQRQMFRGELPTGNWREAPADASPTLRAEIIDYVTQNPGSGLCKLREIKKELETLNRLSPDPIPQLRESDIEKLIERVAPADITDPSLLNELIRQEIASNDISLDTFVSPEQREEIYRNSPDVFDLPEISLQLRYSNGKVKARIANLRDAEALTGEIHLPDGRYVQLMYEKKPYTLEQLKKMSHNQ